MVVVRSLEILLESTTRTLRMPRSPFLPATLGIAGARHQIGSSTRAYPCDMQSRVKGMWWGAAVEAPDPVALAGFYSELLGWPIGHQEPGTTILAARGTHLHRVPGGGRLRGSRLAADGR